MNRVRQFINSQRMVVGAVAIVVIVWGVGLALKGYRSMQKPEVAPPPAQMKAMAMRDIPPQATARRAAYFWYYDHYAKIPYPELNIVPDWRDHPDRPGGIRLKVYRDGRFVMKLRYVKGKIVQDEPAKPPKK